MPKMGSHTSRYASVLARWSELTGDAGAKDKAFRSFNWATYMCRSDGIVNDQPILSKPGIWFSDGYGDCIRHFMAGIGSMPDWAPPEQNHLVRSSSVLSSVRYAPQKVTYKTFDSDATEVLRLSFVPRSVTARGERLERRDDLKGPGWTFDPALKIARIRHANSTEIEISGVGK